ncbi:hypothetical protein ACE14D_04865 [Streptomyces sp. Act-28]
MALTVLVRARMFLPALLVSLLALVLAYVGATTAIVIDLAGRPDQAQRIPYIEITAVATSIATAWLLRPRYWEWERLGGTRVRWYSAGTALVGILLPLLPAGAGVLRLPEDTDPWLVLPMVLLLSALTFTGTALVGVVGGGLLSMTALFAGAMVLNLQPAAAHVLPISYATGQGHQSPHLPGWWLVAPLVVLLAMAVHAMTAGATARSRRLFRNEE